MCGANRTAGKSTDIYALKAILFLFILNTALLNKGNNKITELRTILQRESQNS